MRQGWISLRTSFSQQQRKNQGSFKDFQPCTTQHSSRQTPDAHPSKDVNYVHAKKAENQSQIFANLRPNSRSLTKSCTRESLFHLISSCLICRVNHICRGLRGLLGWRRWLLPAENLTLNIKEKNGQRFRRERKFPFLNHQLWAQEIIESKEIRFSANNQTKTEILQMSVRRSWATIKPEVKKKTHHHHQSKKTRRKRKALRVSSIAIMLATGWYMNG